MRRHGGALAKLVGRSGGRIQGWNNLQQASGVKFTMHDLRRAARTLMSRLGVAEDIAELAIRHLRADARGRAI